MVNVALITLLFGCSPALAALLAPPKALRTREEWLRIKSADDVLTALDCSDITLARTVELSEEEILTWSGILSAAEVKNKPLRYQQRGLEGRFGSLCQKSCAQTHLIMFVCRPQPGPRPPKR